MVKSWNSRTELGKMHLIGIVGIEFIKERSHLFCLMLYMIAMREGEDKGRGELVFLKEGLKIHEVF